MDPSYLTSTYTYWVGMPLRGLMRALQWFMRPSGPQIELTQHHEPVDCERFTENLEVEGAVPQELNGLFIRTGPNPQHAALGGHHLFDGDAMVHAVYFKDGAALSHHNHWCRVPRFLLERNAGHSLWPRLGDFMGKIGLLIIMLDKWAGGWIFPQPAQAQERRQLTRMGNTALVFHNQKLLALNEGALPFLLKACQGFVESVGAFMFGGKLTRRSTAHPKRDPVTGDLHTYAARADGGPEQWCVYKVIGDDGSVSEDVSIDLQKPQMMHDFQITRNYAVFLDQAFEFDPKAMVRDGGLPFKTDLTKRSRIGLVKKPRPGAKRASGSGAGAVKWFEVDPFVCIHTIAAWEEGDDTVCLAVCRGDDFTLTPKVKGSEYYTNGPYAARYTLRLAAGTAALDYYTPRERRFKCEFPVTAWAMHGHRQRYAYIGLQTAMDVDFAGILKVDLWAPAGAGAVARITLPDGHAMGEPYYQPKAPQRLVDGITKNAAFDGGDAVDEGFLLAWVIETATRKAWIAIFDAKTMASEPLARVALPWRVPTGFHSLFVSQAELDTQDPKLVAPSWAKYLKPSKQAGLLLRNREPENPVTPSTGALNGKAAQNGNNGASGGSGPGATQRKDSEQSEAHRLAVLFGDGSAVPE